MKQKTQRSLLKWASLLYNKQLTSIIDIQNTSILIKLLNVLQPLTFQQLYQIDQRSSNSVLSILKSIDKYFKRQLKCNVSSMIENLNIFKTPITVWQLLIGVAIKGRNRDANINVILQMQLQEQSQLMLLVQDVIQKLNQFELKKSDNMSELSSSSEQLTKRDRNKSKFSNEIINEIIEQNQTLKQKVFDLQSQLSQQKSTQQKIKKNYQQRLNQLKTQRYQFLQALTGGSSGIQSAITRSRKNSQFNFRDSIHSSTQSKIFDDPLHDLNISITGTLPQIATDMLNSIKNLKKELALQQQKASLFEDHLKDLKLSLNPLIEQNKILKSQLQKALKLQKECENLKTQNDQLLKNETQMIKIISQVEQQKHYLREMVQKLKQQKNQLAIGFHKKTDQSNGFNGERSKDKNLTESNNILDVNFKGSNQKIDLMKAPSFILRQMGSQIQPQSSTLNDEIENIKNPLIQQKYEKQVNQLREKNNILRQQNNELKQVNKMLQKTVHKSMQKSQEIQKNIEEGYKALFGIKSQIEQKNKQIQKQPLSPVQIKVSHKSNIWQEDQKQNENINIKQQKNQQFQKDNQRQSESLQRDNRIVEFYEQVKKIVESYEQKQLLMMIEIESLKKQLNDLMIQKTKFLQEKQKDQKIKQSQKNVTFNLNKKELKINENIIYEKIQKQEKLQKKLQLKAEQQKINQENKKLSVTQKQNLTNQEIQTDINKKQDSVLMFNINISGPGGQISQTQNSQQYKVRRSQIQQKDSQKIMVQQRQVKIEKDIHPSQEFIQIQQGEEFNENDLPIRKSHQNSQDNGSNNQSLVNQDESEDKYVPGYLGFDYMESQNKLSTISGIGLRFGNDQRRSFFSKSGFYNSSFIEVSNKLQAQIETDLKEITTQLKSHKEYNKIQQKCQYQSEKQKKNNEDMIRKQQQQNKQLVLKLNKIKKSYEKIQQFHIKSTAQIQTQLKQQLSIQNSQLSQLKIKNEQLKQSLTLMIAEKQSTKRKVQQMRMALKEVKFIENGNNLTYRFNEMLDQISQLQKIMPQLQLCLQESKVKQLQILYSKQKQQNSQLHQEIQILLETIVYFRNLAITQQ